MAAGAEEGRSPGLDDAFNGGVTAIRNAGFAFTAIDTEIVLEIAELAVALAIVLKA